MVAKALTALSWLWGKQNWLAAGLLALLLASFTWAYVQGLRLDAARAHAAREIQTEQAAHAVTRGRLAAAQNEISQLRSVLELSRNATATIQASLRDALAREAEAIGAAVARKRILDDMRTRIRTDEETREVVDDATRDAVAARLNRPL